MRIFAVIFGIVLIALVAQDAFETIVLPRRVTRRICLTRLFNRLAQMGWKSIGHLIRSRARMEKSASIPLAMAALDICLAAAVASIEPLDTQVGIDVGLKTFASLFTGEEIANPRFFRQEEKALAKVQRKHSKLAKGTSERRKHRKVIARVHERITFRRDNFTHQQSRCIVDRFGVICVEDLTVNRMVHHHCLAKSIVDASWSAFFAQLFAKAEEAGRTAIKVNPAYTSQTCSQCGHRQKMPLSDRIFNCPCCHAHLERDLNAAYNIRALGLQRLGLSLEAPAF